jgi:beta-N-acetylglucosaminidase
MLAFIHFRYYKLFTIEEWDSDSMATGSVYAGQTSRASPPML